MHTASFEQIETRVEAVLKSLTPDRELPGRDEDLFEANYLDSFGVIAFITALEAEFGIAISNDDLLPQNFWSLEATAQLVQNYLK
ncbi:MAG: acyl carrier protein [Candidatus Melainabacteria bacterium]|nr:acyl carrier protein [Candidatus Melainabacteria bacterium]